MTVERATPSARVRAESDTFGTIEVAGDKYWGAQAQRSLGNFKIGWEKQPASIVRALGIGNQHGARPAGPGAR
jgi:fumarate hydratase class II